MISDLWTIEPQGSPGSAVTLASLGVTSANLSRQSQSPATLALTITSEDALTAAFASFTWESQWVVRRDGEVYFRGRVDTLPRSGDGEELIAIELRDILWDLMRTPYAQAWQTLTTSGTVTPVTIGRVRLGITSAGVRQNTRDAIAQIETAANAAGTTVTIDATALPTFVAPPIEGRGKMVGELLRDILRWHPGASMQTVSTDAGDTVVITDRATAAGVSFAIGSAPLSKVSRIVRRDDLAVASVHVAYESEATQYVEAAAEDGETPLIRSRERLVVATDVWPLGSALTRRSMTVSMGAPDGSGGGSPPLPPIPHAVPIRTRPLPEEGAVDAAAQKFYLERLKLKDFSLTVDDIALAPESQGTISAHTVAFAHALDDPEDPLFEMPSAVNPNSTVVWREAEVSDYPRYLISGQLADWMKVKSAEVVCEATVYVKKSTVDAWSARKRGIFLSRYKPTTGELAEVPAYLVQASVRVMATTAKTKEYRDWASVDTGTSAADSTGGSASAAIEDVVIPDLARKLYEDRSAAPFEGAISLAYEEAPATRHLGRVLNLTGGRSEWVAMRAMIQSESVNLWRGTVDLSFGAPDHLAPSDWLELHRAGRRVSEERGRMGSAPVPPAGEGETDPDDEDGASAGGGVFPPVVGPVLESEATGLGGDPKYWTLEVVDAETGEFRLIYPGTIKRTTALDSSGVLTIVDVDETFTPTAGQILCLVVEPNFTVTLQLLSASWSGWPYPYTVEETTPGGLWKWTKYHFALWDFRSTASDQPDSVQITDTLWAEYRGLSERGHMMLLPLESQSASGPVVAPYEFVPSTGARRPT